MLVFSQAVFDVQAYGVPCYGIIVHRILPSFFFFCKLLLEIVSLDKTLFCSFLFAVLNIGLPQN